MSTQEIDAEIVSEEKLTEKPRPSPTLGQSASTAATSIADALQTFGAQKAADKVRVGVAIGEAAGSVVDTLKPAAAAVKDLGDKLRDAGILKMVPRRPFSPRSKVK